jgi:hypothetical protein
MMGIEGQLCIPVNVDSLIGASMTTDEKSAGTTETGSQKR